MQLRITHPRECVHGALHRVAREALDPVEGVGHQLGPLGQRRQHGRLLLGEGRGGLLVSARGVHHDVHAGLKQENDDGV